jgi:hypothetical protein
MVARFERVTYARFPTHRHAGANQGVDIPVHRTDRDFERGGQLRGSADRTGPQQFQQGEQAIGATSHTDITLAGVTV